MEQAVKITDVNVEDIDVLWGMVEPLIEKGLEHTLGGWNVDDIYRALHDRNVRLWITYTDDGKILAAAICEIRKFPQRTVAYILIAAGKDIELWEAHYESIGEWAMENGADVLVAYTRPGIAKRLKPYGFKSKQVVIVKELTRRSLH